MFTISGEHVASFLIQHTIPVLSGILLRDDKAIPGDPLVEINDAELLFDDPIEWLLTQPYHKTIGDPLPANTRK